MLHRLFRVSVILLSHAKFGLIFAKFHIASIFKYFTDLSQRLSEDLSEEMASTCSALPAWDFILINTFSVESCLFIANQKKKKKKKAWSGLKKQKHGAYSIHIFISPCPQGCIVDMVEMVGKHSLCCPSHYHWWTDLEILQPNTCLLNLINISLCLV